jgi:hypothetical protein
MEGGHLVLHARVFIMLPELYEEAGSEELEQYARSGLAQKAENEARCDLQQAIFDGKTLCYRPKNPEFHKELGDRKKKKEAKPPLSVNGSGSNVSKQLSAAKKKAAAAAKGGPVPAPRNAWAQGPPQQEGPSRPKVEDWLPPAIPPTNMRSPNGELHFSVVGRPDRRIPGYQRQDVQLSTYM